MEAKETTRRGRDFRNRRKNLSNDIDHVTISKKCLVVFRSIWTYRTWIHHITQSRQWVSSRKAKGFRNSAWALERKSLRKPVGNWSGTPVSIFTPINEVFITETLTTIQILWYTIYKAASGKVPRSCITRERTCERTKILAAVVAGFFFRPARRPNRTISHRMND